MTKLVGAAIELFEIDIRLSDVTFNPLLDVDAISPANQIEVGFKAFDTFGKLGSTLIHEAVHFTAETFVAADSRQGRSQEIDALQAEISHSARTGINVDVINAVINRKKSQLSGL